MRKDHALPDGLIGDKISLEREITVLLSLVLYFAVDVFRNVFHVDLIFSYSNKNPGGLKFIFLKFSKTVLEKIGTTIIVLLLHKKYDYENCDANTTVFKQGCCCLRFSISEGK